MIFQYLYTSLEGAYRDVGNIATGKSTVYYTYIYMCVCG